MMKFFASVLALGVLADESSVTVLTDANFMETIGKKPTFVKFYAPWCGHCKNLAPTWDELAGKATGCLVGKLDATVEKKVAGDMKVRGYPTLLMIANDKMYEYNGARSLDKLQEFCDGGWKNNSAKSLPWNETFSDKAMAYLEEYMTKVGQIHNYEPTILPLFWILGLFTALFVYLGVYCCTGGSSAPTKKAPAPKKEKGSVEMTKKEEKEVKKEK